MTQHKASLASLMSLTVIVSCLYLMPSSGVLATEGASASKRVLDGQQGTSEPLSSLSGQFDVDGKPIQYKADTLVAGLDHPWSLTELPDGQLLITERSGQLRLFSDGQLSKPIAGMPNVFVMGQAGLFDIVLHPDFAINKTLFLSYAHGTLESNTLRVARAQLAVNESDGESSSHLSLQKVKPLAQTIESY